MSERKWLCHHFAATRLLRVLTHIRQVHAFEADFHVTCGIDGCPKTYDNFHSYRKHLYNQHNDKLHPTSTHPDQEHADQQHMLINNMLIKNKKVWRLSQAQIQRLTAAQDNQLYCYWKRQRCTRYQKLRDNWRLFVEDKTQSIQSLAYFNERVSNLTVKWQPYFSSHISAATNNDTIFRTTHWVLTATILHIIFWFTRKLTVNKIIIII